VVWLASSPRKHHLGDERRTPRHRPPRRRRGSVRLPALVLVVLAVLAVPWLFPSVPQRLADAVGEPGTPSRAGQTRQPLEAVGTQPPAPAFIGPRAVLSPERLRGRLPAAGVPLRVTVKRLHVDSVVVRISGANGTLLPPSDPQELGWWQEGHVPGSEHGSAVLTGHTVHTGGGALDHLDALLPGDQVRVQTVAGSITYLVTTTTEYDKAALADHAHKLFRRYGPSRLVLVTCSQWNGVDYDANTVVLAIPVA
jgi:LPXTG-site transpeptidase (sortase) family protein